jgi:hypothetical protein
MANVYNDAKVGLIDGTIDLDTDTLYVLLLRSDGGFTPVYEPNNSTVADMLAQGGGTGNEEVTAGGYSRELLGTVNVTQDDTNHRADCDAAKTVFSAVATGQQVGAAVIYKGDSGASDATTNIVIAFYDVAPNLTTNGGDVEIRYDGVDGTGDFLRLQPGANVYNRYKTLLANSAEDLGAATIRVLLLQSSGPPTFDETHNFVSDVTGHANNTEMTVGGYSRQDLGSLSTAADPDPTDEGLAQAQKSTFTALAAGETIGAAVVYRFGTVDGDSEVIAFYDLADTPTNGGDIELLWDGTDGVGTFLKMIE